MADPICVKVLFESRGLPSPCRCPRCAAEKEKAPLPAVSRPRVGKILARVLGFLRGKGGR